MFVRSSGISRRAARDPLLLDEVRLHDGNAIDVLRLVLIRVEAVGAVVDRGLDHKLRCVRRIHPFI